MNTMTAADFSGGAALPTSGLAGLAVRAGRALERWGRRHAAPAPTRDELAALIARTDEAARAAAATEETIRSAGFQPLA